MINALGPNHGISGGTIRAAILQVAQDSFGATPVEIAHGRAVCSDSDVLRMMSVWLLIRIGTPSLRLAFLS